MDPNAIDRNQILDVQAHRRNDNYGRGDFACCSA